MLDTNDLKLLKMKEKLLEVTDINRDRNLEDYKELAIQIDKVCYDNLMNIINDYESNHHNQSLEEELEFLENLEKEYVIFNEQQCAFRNTYERYAFTKLELSLIDNIDIDAIRYRIGIISGYLINLKNISSNEIELAGCNDELIKEEKEKESMQRRFILLENELKKNFLSCEGRKYSKTTYGIEYTSIIDEYKENDIDLEYLLEDKDLLKEILSSALEYKKEKEEKLETAKIAYDIMPNRDSKEVYDEIELDTIRAKYRVSLLKMAVLIAEVEKEYEKVKEKRELLKDLIKWRSKNLEKLGIKFSIDPFSRIKIDEQIDFVSQLKDNAKVITKIREKMCVLTDKLAEMEEKNTEFLLQLQEEVKFIKDNASMASIDITDIKDDFIEDVIFEEVKKEIEENQVVKVKALPDVFMFDRVIEKTSGVIKRVYEMMNNPTEEYIEEEDIVPELLISEPVIEEEIFPVEEYQEPILEDTLETEELAVLPVEEFTSMFTEPEGTVATSNDNDDLFQDVIPFEETKLFNDRFEEVEEIKEEETDSLSLIDLEKIKNKSVDELDLKLELVDEQKPSIIDVKYEEDEDTLDEMPDAFWVTQEEDNVKEDDKVVSFDEQIDKLLSNEGKVRKLTA